MLARTLSMAVYGIDSYPVEIETDMSRGLPTFSIVGLPDSAVRESKQRVTSAISNLGLRLPGKRITVNMAPAGRRKEGPGFDLAIAVSVLAAAGFVPAERISDLVLVGELALDGALRPVPGVLSMADRCMKLQHSGLVVPAGNSSEAALAGEQPVFSACDLASVLDHLGGRRSLEKAVATGLDPVHPGHAPDLSDVRGQECAKRALEVAASGGHNLLMIGSPGSGKTMLARRIPSILPPMQQEESLVTSRIHSVSGLLEDGLLMRTRPFRSPHHTISDAGLIGGGSVPSPGEVSLAHNGVLFLDELPEFRRSVLEVLRQPLEDGCVTIARVASSMTFPARFTLVAAMNPCPCGYFTDPSPHHSCACTPASIQRYLNRISGPLLDRIDIHVDTVPVKYGELASEFPTGDPSSGVRERVLKARERQRERFSRTPGVFTNSGMTSSLLRECCPLDEATSSLLESAMESCGLSARAYDRILKVARTVADLEGSDSIREEHLAEAVGYRSLDREHWR